jgi:hypothetical protein
MTDGYGPELVVNGGFSSGIDSWTISNASIAVNDGVATVSVSSNGTAHINQALSTEVGKTYIASIKFIEDSLAGNLFLYVGTSAGNGNVGALNMGSTIGSYELVFVATATTTYISISSSGSALANDYFRVDNVSVREMPVLKWAPHNLLRYSEQFDNAAWTKTNSTVTANAVASPEGTQTANLIRETSNNAEHFILQSFSATAGVAVTGVAFAKAENRNFFRLAYGSAAGNPFAERVAWFDLSDGSLGTQPTGDSSSSITSLGNDWYLCSLTIIPDNTGSIPFVLAVSDADYGSGSATYTGDGSSGIYGWGAHVFRSDLGGMVDNPERGDSYVPTALRPFGASLVTNGTFDTDTTDWSPLSSASLSVASGALRITNVGANFGKAYQAITVEANKAYVLTFDKIGGTSTDAKVRVGSTAGGTNILGNTTVLSNGSYSFSFVPTVTTVYVAFVNDGVDGNYNDFDNVVVRESSVRPDTARYLPRIGHHVYNGSAWVNEGLLAESESRTNLATYYDDFSNAFWTKVTATITSDDTVAPTGVQAADKITATGDFTRLTLSASGLTDSTDYFVSIYAKEDSSYKFAMNFKNKANVSVSSIFDLQSITASGNGIIQDVGNGWRRCGLKFNLGSGATAPDLRVFTYVSPVSAGVNFNNGESIYIYGAQVEAGSTPSSLIPTSGSSVSRAAETFTIPSANLPWPTPQYIGSELVTNGDFSTDSDWTKGTNATISGGTLSYAGGSGNGDTYQNVGLVVGKVYWGVFTVSNRTAGSVKLRQGGVSSGGTVGASANGTYSSAFVVPSGANANLLVDVSADFVGDIDSVSVREINPLSVSIAMDGRMTFADTGDANEGLMYRWYNDGDNRIQAFLSTFGALTGQVNFYQEENNVSDSAATGNDYYSTGILTPFDIASRHGSTFINGATEGVALTANTTPTALADLSSTDMTIAHVYMGTIGTFRIWDKDIADTGLVEATNPSLEPSLSLTFEGVGTNSFVVNDWSE